MNVVKIQSYLEARIVVSEDLSTPEVKHYIPDFAHLASVCSRAIKNYLKVHRRAGYYKDNFQVAISTLCTLHAATGDAEKLSKLITEVPNYLPCMSEALPKINGGGVGISMFHFEFSSLGHELNKLNLQKPDQSQPSLLQTKGLVWPLFNLQQAIRVLK